MNAQLLHQIITVEFPKDFWSSRPQNTISIIEVVVLICVLKSIIQVIVFICVLINFDYSVPSSKMHPVVRFSTASTCTPV